MSPFSALSLLQCCISNGAEQPPKLLLLLGDPGPHLTRGSLGPPKFTTKTACRSVHSFLCDHACVQQTDTQTRRQTDRETDRQTDSQSDRPRYIDSNRPHLMLCIAMRPKCVMSLKLYISCHGLVTNSRIVNSRI